MSDLLARLLAALDETERVARNTLGAHVDRPQVWVYDGDRTVRYGHIVIAQDEKDGYPRNGAHIVRHDPKRVLLQVAAHRKILDLHQRVEGDPHYGHPDKCSECGSSTWDRNGEQRAFQRNWPCSTLLALVEGYGVEVP